MVLCTALRLSRNRKDRDKHKSGIMSQSGASFYAKVEEQRIKTPLEDTTAAPTGISPRLPAFFASSKAICIWFLNFISDHSIVEAAKLKV